MSLFSILILVGILVASCGLAAVTQAHSAAAKYRHLRWIGTSQKTWWGLFYARLTNLLYMKQSYQEAVDKVRKVSALCLSLMRASFSQ